MQAKWRFASGPMMARFKWYLDNLSQLKGKKVVKAGPPLKKLSRQHRLKQG